jgi:hypothetical protein
MHLKIQFLEDADDSCRPFEENGIELSSCPHVGECVHVNSYYHRVIDVVHDADDDTICLQLGKSAQSPEEARSKGYGLWNQEP